jgi:diguanylate cyclase (GGDEF)-like protein/PAS domain S-box-containing protein
MRTLQKDKTDVLTEVILTHITLSENGIAVFDPQDIFVFHNQAFARMFGLDETSIIGWHVDQWMTWMFNNRGGINIEDDCLQDWLDHVHSVYRSKPFRRFESDMVDGSWLLVSEQIYTSRYIVIHCADITQQKQTEKKLTEALSEIKHLAQTDELTNVPNRRYLLGRLREEYTRAQRYSRPLCLAILDLDHFKNINDQYGHAAGDEVLKHFARFVQSHLRTGDVLGRVGGEEFCVLLPETMLDEALPVLQRITTALAAERIDNVTPGFSYTFSSGVAEISSDPQQNCNMLFSNADKALYQAKAAGRNRVMAFQE